MVNKVIITVHVLDYLILIIIAIVATYTPITELRAAKIFRICDLTIYSVCDVIFGLIIYRLASNINTITASTQTVAQPLMDEEAPTTHLDQS